MQYFISTDTTYLQYTFPINNCWVLLFIKMQLDKCSRCPPPE